MRPARPPEPPSREDAQVCRDRATPDRAWCGRRHMPDALRGGDDGGRRHRRRAHSRQHPREAEARPPRSAARTGARDGDRRRHPIASRARGSCGSRSARRSRRLRHGPRSHGCLDTECRCGPGARGRRAGRPPLRWVLHLPDPARGDRVLERGRCARGRTWLSMRRSSRPVARRVCGSASRCDRR